jgi:hypothetical protein
MGVDRFNNQVPFVQQIDNNNQVPPFQYGHEMKFHIMSLL